MPKLQMNVVPKPASKAGAKPPPAAAAKPPPKAAGPTPVPKRGMKRKLEVEDGAAPAVPDFPHELIAGLVVKKSNQPRKGVARPIMQLKSADGKRAFCQVSIADLGEKAALDCMEEVRKQVVAGTIAFNKDSRITLLLPMNCNSALLNIYKLNRKKRLVVEIIVSVCLMFSVFFPQTSSW